MKAHIELTYNEVLLLNTILSGIKAEEVVNENEIEASVSFKYKSVEQRLLTNVIGKLKKVPQPITIKTTLD